MQFLLDLGCWHSAEEAWTRLFPTQSRWFVNPEKMTKEVQKFSWISFHDLEKSCKFLRILPRLIAKILARKLKNPRIFLARNPRFFLVLLPRSWIVLVFLPRSAKIFLDFFPRSWKILQNLANLAKNNCQDLGKKCQKSKKFLGKKTKTPSTGN